MTEDTKEKTLGVWCQTQRMRYKKETLPKDRVARLDGIGFSWDPHTEFWEQSFAELQAFHLSHPNKWPSSKAKDPKEKTLGMWCLTQRNRYKKETLPKDREERLKKIGFQFSVSMNVT